MLNIISDLIKHHGIASANINVKPHGDSIAAVINLIPNPTAIADEGMRVALAAPIVLIGNDAIEAESAESIMEKVRMGIVGNAYFDSEAIAKRFEGAKPKTVFSPKSSGKKESKPEAKAAPTTPPPAPASIDDIFSADSL